MQRKLCTVLQIMYSMDKERGVTVEIPGVSDSIAIICHIECQRICQECEATL